MDRIIDFYYDHEEGIFIILVCIIATVVIFGLIAAGMYFVDRPVCHHRADLYGYESQWGFYTGCNIYAPTRDGSYQWVNIDNYHVVVQEN